MTVKPALAAAPPYFALRMWAFFAGYFVFGGVSVPFFPVWLQARGLSEVEIANCVAIPAIVRVLLTPLAEAADFVLPGAAYVEKDAIYTNQTGQVQAASRAAAPPGDALDDWQILVNLGRALGLTLPYESSDDVRRAVAAAGPGTPYADADQLVFHRAVPARNWLQASNPSERWKWDFMYQDLPPVKGHNVQMEGVAAQAAFIPLKPVE